MFDHLIITAPDGRRAGQYRELIDRRRRSGLYPREIEFHVVADPPGRIGSGGATILALDHLLGAMRADRRFFEEARIVVLHAGGESRRLPMYAPEGKLLAPVPLATSALDPPILLDLHIASMLRYPWNERAGARGELVVASGDAIVVFDAARLPPRAPGVRGFGVPVALETGARHGVFQIDPAGGGVVGFHQKRSAEFLARCADIGGGRCAMDSGLLAFDPPAVAALASIAEAEMDGTVIRDLLRQGELAIDLYREIVLACIGDADALAAESALPPALLGIIGKAMAPHRLSAHVPEAIDFQHLGTIADFRRACARLGTLRPFYARGRPEIPAHSSGELASVNADPAEIDGAAAHAAGILIENRDGGRIAVAAGPNAVIGLRSDLPATLPPGMCIDQRRLDDGRSIMLVYSESDSFKPVPVNDAIFCGIPLSTWFADRRLSLADLAPEAPIVDLFELPLFVIEGEAPPVFDYWSIPEDAESWSRRFLAANRISIGEANERTCPIARDEERRSIRRRLLRRSILSGAGWRDASRADLHEATMPEDAPRLHELLDQTPDPLLRQHRLATLDLPAGPDRSDAPRLGAIHAAPCTWPHLRWAFDPDEEIIARAPARLDLAGGWSDTPPYTNRFGGHVVNVAVDLDGAPPIEARIRRIGEPLIAVRSVDGSIGGEIRSLAEIADHARPGEALSLSRGALWLAGLRADALRGRSLESLLGDIGGLEISTHSSLPTGSGLGTSSILGAAILAALHRATGIEIEQSKLIALVLELERLLTTGGGWQDQVGGIVPGVKSAITLAGAAPDPIIEPLPGALFIDPQFLDRMTLYGTGITRLAKNILQDVVARVNQASPAYLFTIDDTVRHAALAREAIVREDLDALGAAINLAWRAKRLIHESATNPEVDELLDRTRPHWAAASLLGAGGGGFVLFISPDRSAASRLRDQLAGRSAPPGAGLSTMTLSDAGLDVKVRPVAQRP